MDRHQFDTEDFEDQLSELIDARIHAIKHDVRINRASTVAAVMARLEAGETAEEAGEILRQVVVGLDVEHVTAVELAIFQEAEALALGDMADAEQACQEARDDDRIAYALMDRAFA